MIEFMESAGYYPLVLCIPRKDGLDVKDGDILLGVEEPKRQGGKWRYTLLRKKEAEA